ncbi:30S ribosomal protein S16 [bacterium]|nr:30S ribosomal protein S16 [bacterium]
MVKIRLTRIGRTHTAFFRMVVADSRRARDGKFIEIIGRYQPSQKDKQIELDAERALYWLHNGAQPTETARALLRKQGILKTYHEQKVEARKALDAKKA